MALVVCIPVWALLGPGVSCLVYKIATEIRDHLNYKRSNWESSVQRQESFTQRDKVLRFFYRSLDYVYAIAEAIAVVVFIGILAGWIPVGIFSFFKSVFSFLFKR